MVAESARDMGASDLVTGSKKHRMEIIWKKHHKLGHIYTENINRNYIYITRQVAQGLPLGFFLPGT